MKYIFLVLGLANSTVDDGSLLFVSNGNAIIQNHTNSTLTHVGVILNIDNEPWFYDAVPPKVRKIKLTKYMDELKKSNKNKKVKYQVWLAKPDTPLNKDQVFYLGKYLESQIGRRYSINSFLSGQPGKNSIHCCELTGEACQKIGIHFTEAPCRDAPVDVWKKSEKLFSKRRELTIE